ncbi:MAG: tryptophan 7-halogenase [Rhodocyclales bacterium]|nr:tryptophan 7-halogenase [Rhodocyclales bacterium]
MQQPIKNILIVGGGTAGWITATFLNRFLDPKLCRITLVESEAIGTIGVGEATVPPLVAFLRAMGIDEAAFMKASNATYKLGIKFIDWHRGADEIWHPFGVVGAPQIANLPLFHHWLRQRQEGRDASSYVSYSLQALLGDMSRGPHPLEGNPLATSAIMRQGAYAYHLDARAFAATLRDVAVGRGVRHIIDDVRHVALDQRGFISHVDTAAHGALQADLFIDCSGFAAQLIERSLGDGFVSWADHLLCDSAAVLPLPHDGDFHPCTRATALKAGWCWRIPLRHRVGCGYVYSSRFLSREQAAEELKAHVGQADAAPAHLAMKVGRRENFWVKNCLAVGLSAGFLEPLESTGIYLAQKSVELFLDYFPDTGFDPLLIRRYNQAVAREYDEARDFIVLHYLLNQRNDTGFWRAARALTPPDSLAETLELYDRTGLVDWQGHSLFGDTSFYSIATGFDRLPQTPHAMTAQMSGQATWQAMLQIKAANLALAQSLPDHGDLVRLLHSR